jgi:hypothetical protein
MRGHSRQNTSPRGAERFSYTQLSWILTVLLMLSILPRAMLPRPEANLFAERAVWGLPILGIIGLVLLPGIAFAIGRGKAVPALLAYVVLQGTMRRYLITDCGMPQLLVFWDNVPVAVLLIDAISEGRYRTNRLALWVLLVLLTSTGLAFVSMAINSVPLANAVLGLGRSVLEGPLWLVALLVTRVSNVEKIRLFFHVNAILLVAHLTASLTGMISERSLLPGDHVEGVFGWGGSNYLSLMAGMMLLFLLFFPSRSGRWVAVQANFMPTRRQKAFYFLGWGFLFVWGASRLAIVVVLMVLSLWLALKNLSLLYRLRLARKFSGALVLLILAMLIVGAMQLWDQEGESAVHVLKSPMEWIDDYVSENKNDVNRGIIAQYNLDLMSRYPDWWVWGSGPGTYRSSTGNSLQAPLAVGALDNFGGRYIAPMYLTDMLVEYGAIGLGLLLLVPLLTVFALPWQAKSFRRHPSQVGYSLAILVLLASLTSFVTLEYRGVMVMVYMMAIVVRYWQFEPEKVEENKWHNV